MQSRQGVVNLCLTVARRTSGAQDVAVLDLRDPRGKELPCWAPGAHIELLLGNGLVRQYSLCGDPDDRTVWRIAVLRQPQGRGGSLYVHELLREGCEVDVYGPRNNFPLRHSQSYVFVAGGIGITPILPMVRTIAHAGLEWHLHYGGQSRKSMAFLNDLGEFSNSRISIIPQDEIGIIPIEDILGCPRSNSLVYCCGPEQLLRAVEEHCSAWPQDSLNVERFAARDGGVRMHDKAFEVVLARSGTTLTVPPNKSVLEVVEDAGVPVLSSCREGTCGTCETAVLEGEVDHRDSVLSSSERDTNDTMFICVSRAACPKLVLDM